MRNWRVLTATAAVVLAALAGVLVWKYTDNAKKDAKRPFAFVSVLVAKSRVPKETSFDRALTANLIERAQRVRQDVPDTRVDAGVSDDQLKKRFANLVAGHDITAGQTIVLEDFVASGSVQSGLSGTLGTDEQKVGKNNAQAISVQLDDTHSVGGFLSPGDRVNVIATVDIKDETAPSRDKLTQTGQRPVKTSAFLLPGIKVLAVGNTTGATAAAAQTTGTAATGSTTPTTAAAATNKGIITLEVSPHQALQIAQAVAVGQLYLTLNPATFKPGDFNSAEEIVDAVNLWDFGTPLSDNVIGEIESVTKKK